MRRERRLTTLITNLLMIALVITSVAWACPMTNDAPPGASMAAVMSQAGHPANVNAATSNGARRPSRSAMDHLPHRQSHHAGNSCCEIPCAPSSCTVAGHCGSAACDHAAVTAQRLVAAPGRIAGFGANTPRSVGTGPEPPPPRA